MVSRSWRPLSVAYMRLENDLRAHLSVTAGDILRDPVTFVSFSIVSARIYIHTLLWDAHLGQRCAKGQLFSL